MATDNEDFQERAAIMQFCGKLPKADAERLARERPWDKDPWWGLPLPEQLTLPESEGDRFFKTMQEKFR